MAFTFQINDDIQWRHDEALLAKAEANRPTIVTHPRTPSSLVELVRDETKLMGWWTRPTGVAIEDLPTIALSRDEAITLDFGDHCVGHFSVDIDSVGSPMDAPLFLRLRFAEVPAELASDSAAYDNWLSKSWIQEEWVHLDELPARLELPRRYSFRYVELRVLDTSPKWKAVFSNPVATCESSVDVAAIEPVSVSDPELQRICDVSVKTLADCCQDVFEDGPKRDRRLWLGDLRLQALANYATFDNTSLVKRCLYLFAGMTTSEGRIPANVFVCPKNTPDDTFLFDYSLFFVSSLYDYLEHHDDPEVLADLFPTAQRQVDDSLLHVSEEGELIWDDSYPTFVDWSNDFDKCTAAQAVMIYALRQFVSLSERAGVDASPYEEALARMERFARTRLYDEEKKLFVSGPDRELNIVSQVWMVLAHVMDDETNHEIMGTCVSELFPVRGISTPYMYHHVTHALFEAGRTDDAVRLMKDYWGRMIDLGADTYWEAFDPDQPDYSPYGDPIVSSYCHAWGCTPVWLVKRYLPQLVK